MKAVKAGYSFNLFTEQEVSHIRLEQTSGKVMVEGEIYPLYRGTTYTESQKVDDLLDAKGDMAIREYRVKEKDMER